MFMITPGVRPLINWSTLRIGAFSASSVTLMLATELPILRTSVAVAVPVTMTSLKEIARVTRSKSTVARWPEVTVTSRSCAAKPSCRTATVRSPGGTLEMM